MREEKRREEKRRREGREGKGREEKGRREKRKSRWGGFRERMKTDDTRRDSVVRVRWQEQRSRRWTTGNLLISL